MKHSVASKNSDRQKRKKAVALGYDPQSDTAPKVVAKGQGTMADRLLEVAREHGVPIREDRNLLEVLSTLDLDQEIPEELYRAIAEILAFVYRVNADS